MLLLLLLLVLVLVLRALSPRIIRSLVDVRP
jgi:hypothetical protein